uniref:Translation elongation factor EF1B beta/delta subunit guanine nucleotide exchange domain-containing protein n=1 Tax=Salix viminalis TaxID=40686 RepID=A0A6N2KTX4_SALVM
MAVTFSDLHTESGLKSSTSFSSANPIFPVIKFQRMTSKFTVLFWRNLVMFSLMLASGTNLFLHSSLQGKAVGVSFGGKAAAAPVEAGPAKEATGDEDDDLDLFGDETEEDKKAVEEREKAKKASSKKKESGKSSVLMDVKPWDDETDMVALEKAVRSVEMPGLFWGASKLVPVGYGIKKLQIMLTIVDDLVSVDSLIEEHLTVEPCSEHVQSCDIVAFNKI